MDQSIETGCFALVVDDDPDSQMLVGAMLEYAGHAVRQAKNLDEALAFLEEGPLCVILDLIMPGEASEQLCEAMIARGDDTPVILMSGQELAVLEARRESTRRRGLNVAAILVKPFWLDRLLEALNAAIPVYRADAALSPDPLG